MNFWTAAILFLVAAAPAAALLFSLRPLPSPDVRFDARLCLVAFTMALAGALIGVSRPQAPVTLNFFWPVTTDPSGYFEFALQFFWARFVWIVLWALALFGLVVRLLKREESPSRRETTLLSGAFVAASLGFLLENLLVSVFFFELAAFLLFSFETAGKSEPAGGAFFKRSGFLMLSLCALVPVAALHLLSAPSLILVGVLLYLISGVSSLPAPGDWLGLVPKFLQVSLPLSLFGRVVADDTGSEVWLAVGAVLACCSVGLAILALLSSPSQRNIFLAGLSVSFGLVALRFFSMQPAYTYWAGVEALGLGLAVAMTLALQMESGAWQGWKFLLSVGVFSAVAASLFGVIPGAVPLPLRWDPELGLARVVVAALLVFAGAAAVFTGLISASLPRPGDPPAGRESFGSLLPALLLLFFTAALFTRWLELGAEPQMQPPLSSWLASVFILGCGPAMLAGLVVGILLGRNARFHAWNSGRALSLEALFPPLTRNTAERGLELFFFPARAFELGLAAVVGAGTRLAGVYSSWDQLLFSERAAAIGAAYWREASQLVRSAHLGALRTYLFAGTLVSLLAALVYLWEGR